MSPYEPPEAVENPDTTARICAWAARLTDLNRTDEARQVLLAALDGAGQPVPIMLALAELEADAGEAARAEDLLRKVLGEEPGNVPAVGALVRMLHDAGRTDDALQILAHTPADGATSHELAERSAELLMHMGKPAAAVVTLGPPNKLTPTARRLRRRAWWRSGGPLRSRRVAGVAGALSAPPRATAPGSASIEINSQPADDLLEADAWAEWLVKEGRFEAARQVVGDAISAHGRHRALLIRAARVEEAADAMNTALFLWRESYQRFPDDGEIVCALADRLATTTHRSGLNRIREALYVLDSFPDQSHPLIRHTRYWILRGNGCSAARIAAALGSSTGLPGWSVAERRRLLLRSCGPLGQLSVRLINRIYDRRYPQPTQPIRGIDAESEAVARVLDAVKAIDSSAAARDRIDEAMREHGRTPALLLACAETDESEGERWHRLAMAAEATRTSGGNADAVCALAGAIEATYGYGSALQALASMPPEARQAPQARAAACLLHQMAGQLALAVKAVGDPRDLDQADRRQRRRQTVKTLLSRLRPGTRTDVSAMDTASFDPVPVSIARTLDQSESQEEPQARETLQAAIDEQGRHPLLLLRLAEVERWAGNPDACAALAREAARAAAADPLITASAIRGLWLADCDAEALRAIDNLPDDCQASQAIRAVAGDVCQFWQLRDQAVIAWGNSGLEAWRWRERRACWWGSGGPWRRIRSAIGDAERNLLYSLTPPSGQEPALSALLLSAQATEAVRADLDNYRLGRLRANVSDVWLRHIVFTAFTVATFAGLTTAEALRWPSDSVAYSLTAAALATGAAAVAAWVLTRLRWGDVVAQLCQLAVVGAGAWFLLHSVSRPVFGAGLALAALAARPIALYPLGRAIRFGQRVRTARWQRSQAEAVTLNGLLILLGDLLIPRLRRDASLRRAWMADLERLAVGVERDLPHALATGDAASQRMIEAHARGAAAALRHMKETIALPTEAAWSALTDELISLAQALAGHDFSAWPTPLPEVVIERAPRPPWRRAADATRIALVIFAPPLVAFLLPMVAPLSGPGVPWLRFATTVWALLGLIIALDPDWSNRIAKMREWIALVRSATPMGGSDDGAPSYEPIVSPPPQASDAPRRPSPRPVTVRPTRPHRYR